MHATMHETCTDCAVAVRFEDSTAPLQDRPPALELGHSRACVDPVDVGNRPQFRANGCTGAPEMHRECMQLCTKHALAARLEDSSKGFVTSG